MSELQQQYQAVIQHLARLRQTASALKGCLGAIITVKPSKQIAQLRLLEVETKDGLGELEKWHDLDAAVHSHPEAFQESLQQLLPLSDRSEIEVDLLSQIGISLW